jgi:RNA polymerase sigma-70 factor (ECF subfamily)
LYLELVTYASGYLFDKASSEDVVQEVFLFLWEESNKIDLKTNLKAYLYAMVRNRCLDRLKAVQITDGSKILEAQTAFSINYSTNWVVEEEKEIRYQQAMDIIENLPVKMRIIVKLRLIENYRYKEIADELNVSLNTVKTQLKRAKAKLAELAISLILILSIV